MEDVQPIIDSLNDVKGRLFEIANDIIKENASEIVLLVKSQLSSGKNSSDKPLSWAFGDGFYSANTQYWADRDNVPIPKTEGSPYNFSWSGETLDNLQLGDLGKDFYEITTIAYKKDLLEKIYGEIFDLTEEHNDFVNENILLPNLYEKALENSLGKFI